jgi:hypothetical protein
MKFRPYNLLKAAGLGLSILVATEACRDEDLNPYIEPEKGALHGFSRFAAGSSTSFIVGDDAIDIDVETYWANIGGTNTASKIEVYALFNESYIDANGNPAVARHGGTAGRLLRTIQGGDLKGNKVFTPFSVTQDELYALYDDATFDYEGTGTAVSVWANPDKPDRDEAVRPFISGDAFQLRWIITAADGRVFDSWSPSVCTEFPGANCSLSWVTICNPVIQNPQGDYILKMVDSYGDGWNNAVLIVVVDGVETEYTLDDGSAGQEVVTIPDGTTTLTFEFRGGDWDSEVTFEVVSPSGNVIAKGGPSPADGELVLDLCKE